MALYVRMEKSCCGCLYTQTRACYDQMNVCCVRFEHAPFYREYKRRKFMHGNFRGDISDYVWVTGRHALATIPTLIVGFRGFLQCLKANTRHFETGQKRLLISAYRVSSQQECRIIFCLEKFRISCWLQGHERKLCTLETVK